MYKLKIWLLLLGLSFAGCRQHNHYIGVDNQYYYKTGEQKEEDKALDAIIAPYRQQVDSEMNKVVGQVAVMLTKEQPESTLGNWAADVVAVQSALYTETAVDFSVLNYGGLRIPSIAAGPITKGKVFELMPFDNMLVIVEMQGKELPLLFEQIASKGGWPISEGLQLLLSNGHFKSAKIQGKEIDPNKTYRVATIDYLANGGDACTFFVGKKQIATAKFMRDAVIEYLEAATAKNLSISAVKQGRIVVEK